MLDLGLGFVHHVCHHLDLTRCRRLVISYAAIDELSDAQERLELDLILVQVLLLLCAVAHVGGELLGVKLYRIGDMSFSIRVRSITGVLVAAATGNVRVESNHLELAVAVHHCSICSSLVLLLLHHAFVGTIPVVGLLVIGLLVVGLLVVVLLLALAVLFTLCIPSVNRVMLLLQSFRDLGIVTAVGD